MNDIDFLKKIMQVQKGGKRAAVATIIRTKGSTPRKTGSRMVVFPNGTLLGTIGGGCGEAEVIEKAFIVIESRTPTQCQVDLTQGLFFEDGGICGGIMDVFIEPV